MALYVSEADPNQVLSMMNDAADYIHENQPGALSAYGFKVSGKEEYVFVER
jgi:hypothetical protein